MLKISTALAIALAIAPMQAISAEQMQDGNYTYYSQHFNRCYEVTVSGGDVTTLRTFFTKDCSGDPFANWPVNLFNGGWEVDGHSWYIHGWTDDSLDVRYDRPTGRAFDFRKR